MENQDILTRVFARLGREKDILEYRDILRLLLGVVMDFINADGQSLRLSKGENFNPLCNLLRKDRYGSSLCHKCDLKNAQIASATGTPRVYRCYVGLTDIVVPLYDNANHYLGCITSGQFRLISDRKSAATAAGNIAISSSTLRMLASFSQKSGISLKKLHRLYCGSRFLTRSQVDGLIKYLQVLGRLLVTTHHNLVFMESMDAPDKITLAKQYINKHFAEPLTLAAVAQKCSIAPQYFCRLFKQECGVGFNAYLNYYRMEKAKEFLRDSSLYIANIASLTGFGSVKQFNRIFHRHMGTTPGHWRHALSMQTLQETPKQVP